MTSSCSVPRRYPCGTRSAPSEPSGSSAALRPRAVIAQSPPVVPALIASLYSRLAGVPLVLDSHPSSFGIAANRFVRWQIPLLARLGRRAAAVMVSGAGAELAEAVREWGGTPLVFHEARPDWTIGTAPSLTGRPSVLFISTFAVDEPVAEVLEAARLLPEEHVLHVGASLRASHRGTSPGDAWRLRAPCARSRPPAAHRPHSARRTGPAPPPGSTDPPHRPAVPPHRTAPARGRTPGRSGSRRPISACRAAPARSQPRRGPSRDSTR